MPGMPLTPYLADVLASMQGQYALAPPPEADPGSLVSQPPPVMSAPAPVVGPMPPPEAGPEPTPIAPAPAAPAPVGSMGPPSPPPRDIVDFQRDGGAPEAAPSPRQDPHAFDLTPTMGGGAPAHEVETRGPSVLNAQAGRNEAVGDAIATVAGRNDQAAQDEYAMAVSQERAARVREDALQQSLAEQQDELQARQDDFDTTARQMSRLGQEDPNRFYNSRSTLGKIAAFTELGLAGFRNAPSMVMKRIDDDVKAQEFAYNGARDQLGARQTAFSAAMAKYQNAGAARAMARVAAIDVQSAQLGQIAAKNKGNETGNRAIEAMAQLANERMMQIQQGVRFVPATAGGRFYMNPTTGLIYNEKEAHEYEAKNREFRQQDSQERAKVGGQILVQRDKAELEQAPGGMTREQMGKIEMEHKEKQTAVDAMNNQFTSMINNPVLDRLSPIRAARAKLPGAPRHSPEEYEDKQELTKLNQEFLTTLGKVAKDNEGKPGVAMLKKFEDNFRINQGFDTKESAIKNIRSVQEIANNLYAQGGAAPMSRALSPEAKKSLGGYSK